jgi:hypothetical protein
MGYEYKKHVQGMAFLSYLLDRRAEEREAADRAKVPRSKSFKSPAHRLRAYRRRRRAGETQREIDRQARGREIQRMLTARRRSL